MITQLEKDRMVHALGLDSKKPRWRKGYRYYYPYRNYYGAGNIDTTWEGLVEKGLADTSDHKTYFVTLKGLSELSSELDMHIYSDCSSCVGDAKYPIFRKLVDIAVSVGPYSDYPVSSKRLSRELRIPLKMVRETLRYLSEQGLVTKTYEGGCSEEEGIPYCHHGYCITEEGTKHPYYKEAYDKEMKRIQQVFFGGNT